MKIPATRGNPIRWLVTIDRPAKTLSNAAVASKSVNIPGDSVWRERSRKRSLFNTALLHVWPGSAYWAGSRAKKRWTWQSNLCPHMAWRTKLRSASHYWIILEWSMWQPFPFSIITWEAVVHCWSGVAVIKDRCVIVRMSAGRIRLSRLIHSKITL